jgi:hypothetical protein
MKNLILVLSAAAGITFLAPAASNAQIGIDVPGVGVRIGEPRRDYDRPRYRERRGYREREVRGGCRTVTIERDDGSMRRIRRCD